MFFRQHVNILLKNIRQSLVSPAKSGGPWRQNYTHLSHTRVYCVKQSVSSLDNMVNMFSQSSTDLVTLGASQM